jgi:hypothetical protein
MKAALVGILEPEDPKGKGSDHGTSMTTTYPTDSDQNGDTQTATRTVSLVATTCPQNMTARPASGKRRATRIAPPFKTKWEAPIAIAFTTKANDGVGGMINSMKL